MILTMFLHAIKELREQRRERRAATQYAKTTWIDRV